MKKKFNIYDLNFLLFCVGFPFVTTFLPSISSEAYRLLATGVGILGLLHQPRLRFSPMLSLFIFLLSWMSANMLFDLFIGEYVNTPFTATRKKVLLYVFFVVWIPLLAFITGFRRMNWNTDLRILQLLLFMIIATGCLRSHILTAENGRHDLNARQTTLFFGENSGFLILVSIARLQKIQRTRVFTIVFSLIAICLGIYGMARAGSRGPFVATCVAALYGIFILFRRHTLIALTTMVFLSVSAYLFLDIDSDRLRNFAPVLYERMERTVKRNDMSGREKLFAEGIEKFGESPLTGTTFLILTKDNFYGYHNTPLEFFLATGIIGGILFMFLMLRIGFLSSKKRVLLLGRGHFFLLMLFWYFVVRGLSGVSPLHHPLICVAIAGACMSLSKTKKTRKCISL